MKGAGVLVVLLMLLAGALAIQVVHLRHELRRAEGRDYMERMAIYYEGLNDGLNGAEEADEAGL